MTTVLIVEDDPINVKVFSKVLTKKGGLAVLHTENVEEVMQIAQSKGADIILMDVSLCNSFYEGKRINGLQITRMLKENAQTSDLPVILVTANGADGDRENYLEQSGADGYIPKPVVDHQKFVDDILAMVSKS